MTPGYDVFNRRYCLVSLLDLMKLYDIGKLTDLQSFMVSFASRISEPHMERPFSPDQFELIRSKALLFYEKLEEMNLPVSAVAAKTVLNCLNAAPVELRKNRFGIEEQMHVISGQNKDSLEGALRNITNLVGDELSTKLVLTMPNDKAKYFQPPLPVFPKEVVDKFPSGVEDMFEAGNCFALGRNTACVFHLMRIMEIAVQKFGDKLGVSLVTAMGKDKVWHNLLEEADKEIRRRGALAPPDPLSSDFARISSNLYSVKLAWRNPVMHPKATYTENEAESVLYAVRSFLSELAKVL